MMNRHRRPLVPVTAFLPATLLLMPTASVRAYHPDVHAEITQKALDLYEEQRGSHDELVVYSSNIKDGAEDEDETDHVYCYDECYHAGEHTLPHFWSADGGLDNLMNFWGDWPNAWMKLYGRYYNKWGCCDESQPGLWPQAAYRYNPPTARSGHMSGSAIALTSFRI